MGGSVCQFVGELVCVGVCMGVCVCEGVFACVHGFVRAGLRMRTPARALV